ncbi:transmembrane protein 14C-like protein [Helicostylum pulchrum]|uniref:Transmembrane protein 14C n=1 Tax=Helicostylum pulchrum TaxID=562976 RepID=A0ABP9Y9B2_9FUNG|nr:transmembrane protein 14C-like protein [Helicostylum pulchrum]
MTDVIGYCYGLIVLSGGAIGYLKAGSIMSLLAGAIFGFLAAYGAYLDSKVLALVTSLLLLSVMGPKFYRGRKFMPAGLVTILSIIMAIRYGMTLV